MVGSIKYHKYDLSTDNSGNFVWYKADESNLKAIAVPGGAYADAAGETIFDFTPADSGTVNRPLPKDGGNFKRRKARFVGDAGGTRTIIIPSQAMLDDLFNGVAANVNTVWTDADTGETFTFAGQIPQNIRIPVAIDTGKDDGTPA